MLENTSFPHIMIDLCSRETDCTSKYHISTPLYNGFKGDALLGLPKLTKNAYTVATMEMFTVLELM